MTAFTQLAQAARLAREALGEIEWSNDTLWQKDRAQAAMESLDAALAAAQAVAEQEPAKERHPLDFSMSPKQKLELLTKLAANRGFPSIAKALEAIPRVGITSPPAQAPAEVASKGVRDALETLVSLKDLKESIATAPNANEAHRRDEQYRRLQPFAWIEARRVLATPTQPLPTAAAIEQVPEGFVLVPREPTLDMIMAGAGTPGMKAINDSCTTMQLRGYPLDPEAFKSGAPLTQAWRAMLAATPTHPAPVPLCACKDRPASECDEEWGPNCDLGNNPAHVRVVSPEKSAEVDAILGIQRAAPVLANGLTEAAPEDVARLIAWLEAKWQRHKEIEDKEAAEMLRRLAALRTAHPTKDAGELPPLPEHVGYLGSPRDAIRQYAYTADQMRAYALAARTSPAAPSQEAGDDAALLDWLETLTVNVRLPLRYGSLNMFWSSPEEVDGGEPGASDIRAKLRAAMAATTSTPGEQA